MVMITTLDVTPSQEIQERDTIAPWLPVAEDILMAMGREDSRFDDGFAKWKKRLERYEELCRKHPEGPA